MILAASAILVLAAAGLLLAGVAAGSAPVQWAAVALSVAAVALLAVPVLSTRRRNGTTAPGRPGSDAPRGAFRALIAPRGAFRALIAPLGEVLVVDERPSYHRAGCAALLGAEAVPVPVDQARGDGFTACGRCRPDGAGAPDGGPAPGGRPAGPSSS